MKILTILTGLLFPLFLMAQENTKLQFVEKSWEKALSSTSELIELYHRNRSQIKKLPASFKEEALHLNACFMLLKSGDFIVREKKECHDIDDLLKQIPDINLESTKTDSFMAKYGVDTFADYYFMIKALKKKATFDDARDGVSFSTLYPGRALNFYDYTKLKDIFSGKNERLQSIYLEKMKFLFRINGCTDDMMKLWPIIKKNIPESDLKNEILELYRRYEKIRQGESAPASVLRDSGEKEYRLSDFRGKVVVVDVWATWCCSCIEKMPSFIQLRDEFKNDDRVVFLTISIDGLDLKNKWQKTIGQNKMTDMLNLLSGNESESSFMTDYCIPSVPRYFVIDQTGKIVTVYAPSPGKELKQIIINTFKR